MRSSGKVSLFWKKNILILLSVLRYCRITNRMCPHMNAGSRTCFPAGKNRFISLIFLKGPGMMILERTSPFEKLRGKPEETVDLFSRTDDYFHELHDFCRQYTGLLKRQAFRVRLRPESLASMPMVLPRVVSYYGTRTFFTTFSQALWPKHYMSFFPKFRDRRAVESIVSESLRPLLPARSLRAVPGAIMDGAWHAGYAGGISMPGRPCPCPKARFAFCGRKWLGDHGLAIPLGSSVIMSKLVDK